MTDQTIIKTCIVVSALTAAFFAFASVRTIGQMWGLLPLPTVLVLMAYVPAAMCLLAALTSYNLVKYRKRAQITAALMATSPAWPLLISFFDTAGHFAGSDIFPPGTLIWTIVFGAIAWAAKGLTERGVLQ